MFEAIKNMPSSVDDQEENDEVRQVRAKIARSATSERLSHVCELIVQGFP